MKDELTVSSPKILPPRGDIRVEFTGKNPIKFGGIQLVWKFLRQLRVKEELEGAVLIEKRESKFSVEPALFTILIVLIVLLSSAALTPCQGQQDEEALRKASQNPVADIISLPLQDNILFGVGPDDDTANVLNIQPVVPINIGNWQLYFEELIQF